MALPPDERRDRAKVNEAVRPVSGWAAAACRHRGPIRRSEGDGRKHLKRNRPAHRVDVHVLRHGGPTESKSSGLTALQLMDKGQWSSMAAMGNYLHDDDEGKQEAQMKRIKRRAKSAKRAARK